MQLLIFAQIYINMEQKQALPAVPLQTSTTLVLVGGSVFLFYGTQWLNSFYRHATYCIHFHHPTVSFSMFVSQEDCRQKRKCQRRKRKQDSSEDIENKPASFYLFSKQDVVHIHTHHQNRRHHHHLTVPHSSQRRQWVHDDGSLSDAASK